MLNPFVPLTMPWSGDSIQCSLAVGPDVYFGMSSSGRIWKYSEVTGFWTQPWTCPGTHLMALVPLPADPTKWVVSQGAGTSGKLWLLDTVTGLFTLSNAPVATYGWFAVIAFGNSVLAFESWNGQVWRTTDGLSWARQSSPGTQAIFTALATSDGSLYMGGEGVPTHTSPLRSSDGGHTWQSIGLDGVNSHGNCLRLAEANGGDILIGRQTASGQMVQRRKADGSVVPSAGNLPLWLPCGYFAVLGNNIVLLTCGSSTHHFVPQISTDDGYTWYSTLGNGLPKDASAGNWCVSQANVYYFGNSGLYVSAR